jgi:hypothetical protein
VRAQGDLQTRDLRITGSVGRRSGRQRPGETDERKRAAHESDQFCSRERLPSRSTQSRTPPDPVRIVSE